VIRAWIAWESWIEVEFVSVAFNALLIIVPLSLVDDAFSIGDIDCDVLRLVVSDPHDKWVVSRLLKWGSNANVSSSV